MSGDDFIETDGGVHNIRVYNNRGVNAAHGGLQLATGFRRPGLLHSQHPLPRPSGVAFKFSAKAAGLFAYHNTIIGEQVARDPSSNMHYRNNLFLGRGYPGSGCDDLVECNRGPIVRTTTATGPTRESPSSIAGSLREAAG